MARYLIQVDPTRAEEIKSSLSGIGIRPISQAFDYISVDVPEENVPKIRAISGVITVTPEKKVEIKQVVIPVEKKLAEFQRLFSSNPITGPAMAFKFSLEVDMGKQRIPTSISRKMVGADVAEAEGITGKGVKVAVLDTGTDVLGVQGPYLGGRSSTEGQPVQIDENGHGTHVQTTISGRPFQSIHGLLRGVAIDAEVAAFKVLGYGIGAGTNSSVLRGMMDAFEWGADIISMSLGSPYTEESPDVIPECRAIKMLTEQGIIVVVANGNDGPEPNTVGVPANSPYALSVGAVDINGNVASFSSRGPTAQGLIKPDCVAPGVNILSTSAGLIATMQFMDGPPKLAAISGTSMATPHASGVVALALQYARIKGKNLTTNHIKEALATIPPKLPEQAAERAVEMTRIEKNNDTGWGLITYQRLKRYIDKL